MKLASVLAQKKLEIGVALLCTTLVLVFTVFYVGQEHYFYFSDFNFYHIASIKAAETLSHSANALVFPLLIYISTGLSHNLIFTLPIAPTMLAFGTTRPVFIASIIGYYVIPYMFLLAAVTRACAPRAGKRALWLFTLVTAMTMPALWISALRGYPDQIAALPPIMGLLLYLACDRKLTAKNSIALGVLLGLSPFLRRHYFFADFALLLAIFLDQICSIFLDKEIASGLTPRRAFVRSCLYLALAVMSMAVFLATVGHRFLDHILKNNYLSLYKSAFVPLGESLGYFVVSFGLPVSLMAVVGFYLALRHAGELFDKKRVRFLLLFSIFSALIWPLFGKHLAQHYLLYWTPLIIAGASFLLYFLYEEKRRVLLFLSLGFMLGNLVLGYLPREVVCQLPIRMTRFGMLRCPEVRGDSVAILFCPSFAPLTRDDFPEMRRLVVRLRELSAHGEKIFDGCTWEAAETDAIRNAERYFFGEQKARLNILNAPYADSIESFPIERMMQSQYALIVNPPFYLYSQEGEKLVDVLNECFDKHWQFASDFTRLDDRYQLAQGYTLVIYKRDRASSIATIIKTIEEMERFIPIYPGGQPLWIDSDEASATLGDHHRDRFRLAFCGVTNLTAQIPPEHFLLTSRRYEGPVTVSGQIELPESSAAKGEKPAAPKAVLTSFDSAGNITGETEQVLNANNFKFALSLNCAKPARLLLRLLPAPGLSPAHYLTGGELATISELKIAGKDLPPFHAAW